MNAQPGGGSGGRPGDARFVFGIFKDGETLRPVGVALYPEWPNGHPQTYRTPVGEVKFAHVGPITGVKLGHAVDADGKGFVLVAGIPRAAIPRLPAPLGGNLRTLVDFEVTLGGHNKFWWSNADGSASRETYDEPTEARFYPGAWSPVQFQGLDNGVTVRHWLICGPFGGPGAEKFMWDLRGNLPGTNQDYKKAGQQFCEAAQFPPDAGVVDPTAVFAGEMIRGYWNDPRKVQWKPATIADLDTRVILGQAAQVWYGATWVFAPAETDLEFQFQGHPQTFLHWTVNNEPVKVPAKAYQPAGAGHREVASQSIHLHTGWNQIMFRGYCVGYGPFRAGLVLAGPPEKLWNLRLSATPHH